MGFYEEKEGCIELSIRVVPRAARNGVAGLLGDELKVRIQAPPVDGKANDHLIRYLAKTWDVPRASITILSGETGRRKRLRIINPSAELFRTLRDLQE